MKKHSVTLLEPEKFTHRRSSTSLALKYPILASEWSPRNQFSPAEVAPVSHLKAWWKCKHGHEWEAQIGSRSSGGNGCPYCSHQLTSKEDSLAIVNPELILEWDNKKNELTPYDVTPGSGKGIWWKCCSGHSWKTTPASRVAAQSGCPACSRKNRRHSVVLGSGICCDSLVEAMFYLKYEKAGLKFVHRYRYGKKLGCKTCDFYFPDSNTFVEVTAYNKSWRHWKTYERNINIKREYVKSIGGKFIFHSVTMTQDEIEFTKKHIDPSTSRFMPYLSALKFSRNLNLKNIKGWRSYCESGKCPKNIPQNPEYHYKNLGWSGYGEWLGTGNIRVIGIKWKSFHKARLFARSLKMDGQRDWFLWRKSGKRPKDIPSDPSVHYKNKGWISWGNWLGK